jgi:hypothetical protein
MSFSPEPTHAAAAGTTRCRSCGSRLRPEDEWCTLCLTRVAPEEPEEPQQSEQPEEPAAGAAEPEPLAADRPVEADAEDAAGDDGDDEDDEDDPDEAARRRAREAEAERMLAELAATESRALPPRLAALNTGGRAGGAVLATLGGVVVLAVLMAVMVVAGRFL